MSDMQEAEKFDVLVAGAGLAGLTAAAFLARAGKRVAVLERSAIAGGRATSRTGDGFTLNLGPHALYARGAGVGVLAELGVSFRGAKPAAGHAWALAHGRKHVLPVGLPSMLMTRLLRPADKLELAGVLGSIAKQDASAWDSCPLEEWLAAIASRPGVRQLLSALVRLTSYVDASDVFSAGAAIRQLQLAVAGNVYYLDGGWQTLVDGLLATATRAGAQIRLGAKIAALTGAERVTGVRTADGRRIAADTVILATPPGSASAIAGPRAAALWRFARRALPVRAACLDLELSRLPVSRATFALGIDAPVYFSVHSSVAKLAPAGKAVAHVAKYLKPGGAEDAAAVRAELEAVAELVQPGWRDELHDARYLPRLTVAQSLPTADGGGLAGRPAVGVAELPGLYLAGDWVGDVGLLADASFASARRLASESLEYLAGLESRRVAA